MKCFRQILLAFVPALMAWGAVARTVDVRDFGATGMGDADDSQAIQRALDIVERPLVVRIPKGDYRIGRTLYVSGGTRIEAAHNARLFVCERTPHREGDYLLTNIGSTNGTMDAGVEIVGGVWDGNSRRGTNVKPSNILEKDGWSGVLLNFRRVAGLVLDDMECANSVTYNIRMCEIDGFSFSGLRFSAREIGWNQDGIHMNGYCQNGRIENVRAISKGQTADDLLAFNADDSMVRIENRGMVRGPIANIFCRDIFAEDCHSAIRFLSVGSAIRNIRIENIAAGCRCHAINADAARHCLTPLFKSVDSPSGVGNVCGVSISNFTFWATSAHGQPMVSLETNVRDFKVVGLERNHLRDSGGNRPFLQVRNCATATIVANGNARTVSQGDDYVMSETPESLSCVMDLPYAEPVPARANTLSDDERRDGWALLFDGIHLPTNNFVGVQSAFRSFPERGWRVKDGCLTVLPQGGFTVDGVWTMLPEPELSQGGGGDIATRGKYRDFTFCFDFRLTRAANSGVKYFYDENRHGGTSEEYQLLDAAHPDFERGRDGNRRIAALYDVLPASADSFLKPVGHWNKGKIVAEGRRVEHWLNGRLVLAYERGSDDFRTAVSKSKYAIRQDKVGFWGEIEEGRVLLQDHQDSTVSFCNIKIKSKE